MSSTKEGNKLREQVEFIRLQLRQNRLLIGQQMGSSDDVFPRSVAMQLITQQKMSDIIPLYNMALAGLRIFRFISAHNKAHHSG
jgi:hypothetical protein